MRPACVESGGLDETIWPPPRSGMYADRRRDRMLKFLGGTIGIIFLIGLLVVIGILMLIF